MTPDKKKEAEFDKSLAEIQDLIDSALKEPPKRPALSFFDEKPPQETPPPPPDFEPVDVLPIKAVWVEGNDASDEWVVKGGPVPDRKVGKVLHHGFGKDAVAKWAKKYCADNGMMFSGFAYWPGDLTYTTNADAPPG